MKSKQIKICGIKLPQNFIDLSQLKTNFIGLIFYTNSPRFIGEFFPFKIFPKKKKRIGVFVKYSKNRIFKIIQKSIIVLIQLHGHENVEFYKDIYKNNISIIKVFRIKEKFNLIYRYKYHNYSLYFLFDKYCIEYGGSGKKFSWKKIRISSFYPNLFMSGGIEIKDFKKINNFYIIYFFIDLNSKFEIKQINKNKDELRRFIRKINL